MSCASYSQDQEFSTFVTSDLQGSMDKMCAEYEMEMTDRDERNEIKAFKIIQLQTHMYEQVLRQSKTALLNNSETVNS